MGFVYTAFIQQTLTANADNLVIEITAPANVIIKIKKIRISHSDGTDTTSADYHRKVKLITESVAGTGGSTFTGVPLFSASPAASSTVKTGLTALGTISTTIDIQSQHNTTDYIWQTRDEDDKIVLKPSGIFGVVINPAQ